MKTLVSTKTTIIHITTPFPIKPNKIPTLQHHQRWKIHSSPKGFNKSPPPSTKNGKYIRLEEIPIEKFKNSSNNDDDNDDKIPDVVFDRMIARILLYVGAPLGAGILFLQVFGILKQNNVLDVPTWLPFLTTFFTFGASALGVAYGTLSTSWDPEKKGSILGFEEAKRNWVEMWKEEDESKG